MCKSCVFGGGGGMIMIARSGDSDTGGFVMVIEMI